MLEFVHVDARRNRFRRYMLSEQLTLFGELELVIRWGRIGSPLRMRTEAFRTRVSLAVRRGELAQLRKRHGYSLVTASRQQVPFPPLPC